MDEIREETTSEPEPEPCDGCGGLWPICALQKHCLTFELLCPECWDQAWE